MKVEILSTAEDDLVDGHLFYERQEAGIGDYFLDTLFAEIDSLQLYAGTHRKVWAGTACSRNDFHSASSTQSPAKQFKSARSSTFGDGLHFCVVSCAEMTDRSA